MSKNMTCSCVGIKSYSFVVLIPECNGLSQFIEDTGEASIPVPEFNLIACPLAANPHSTPGFEHRLARALSPAGTVAY